jgi:hypothetical protein
MENLEYSLAGKDLPGYGQADCVLQFFHIIIGGCRMGTQAASNEFDLDQYSRFLLSLESSAVLLSH